MAQVDVEMPKMGESITEGTVIAWHKDPGDAVEQDEILLEIGTDKVDTEVPSPTAGILTEMLVEEGDTVEVGTVIARVETEEQEAEVQDPSETPPAEAEETEAPDPETAEAAEAGEPAEPADSGGAEAQPSSGEEVEVVMPKMGESITEGTVIAWYKDIGDEVAVDETLLEIGTDKVDTEVPSPAAGVLTERLVEEGETVEVGTVVALLASEAEAGAVDAPVPDAPDEETTDEEAADSGAADSGAADSGAPTDDPEPETTEVPSPPPSGDGTVHRPETADRPPEETIKRRGDDGRFYSPLVRSIAKEEGIYMSELESLDGSGREGRVTKEDVLAYLEEREEAPAPSAAPSPAPEQPAAPSQPEPPARGGYTVQEGPDETKLKQQYGERIDVQPMDRMRKLTAEHMVRSKATSAHVTSFAEADVTGLVRFREKHKEAFQEQEGVKLTFTPFFVKAAVEALREHPTLNASVEGDKIVMKKDYHVGIAVAIGSKGLLAPVIRNAGDYNVVGLARKAANMADRARSKELQPEELQGGTFTVTNIGSLGSLMGTPIINQPQVGILATGAIQKRPVVIEDDDLGDVISVRHMMYLSLSYDHRIIDGAMGASFLQRVVQELEAFSEDDNLF